MRGDGSVNPFLRIEGLGRSVSGKVILENITLDAAHGEVLALVGPSGSGKSSLLRLLNRLDEPTSGTVWLDGVDYRTVPPRELRRRVGMMLQHAYLFPGTVADNIRFGPAQRGEQLAEEQLAQLLVQVGLPGFASRDVAELSGGEAQRVSLARILANRPSVLLLDEPTSALDESLKLRVERLILEVAALHSLTCLWVTHDQAEARRVAGRVAVIEASRLVRSGLAEEVLHVERPN